MGTFNLSNPPLLLKCLCQGTKVSCHVFPRYGNIFCFFLIFFLLDFGTDRTVMFIFLFYFPFSHAIIYLSLLYGQCRQCSKFLLELMLHWKIQYFNYIVMIIFFVMTEMAVLRENLRIVVSYWNKLSHQVESSIPGLVREWNSQL